MAPSERSNTRADSVMQPCTEANHDLQLFRQLQQLELRIARHLGWLLRHHRRNGSAASRAADTPRPAAIQISSSAPPRAEAGPAAETRRQPEPRP